MNVTFGVQSFLRVTIIYDVPFVRWRGIVAYAVCNNTIGFSIKSANYNDCCVDTACSWQLAVISRAEIEFLHIIFERSANTFNECEFIEL